MTYRESKINISQIVGSFRRALLKEYDGTIAISGFVGEGKSTFALQCMKAYYNITTLADFKKHAEKLVVYNRKTLYQLATQEKKEMIIADESINLLFKREWAKDNQMILIKAFDVCRDNGNIFIFNIPSFWALDSHIVQTRIRLWIHVEKQKYAHIFAPMRGAFAMDVWARKYNEKLHEKRKGIKYSPNYVDTITFPPLERAEYEAYKAIKGRKRLDVEGKGEDGGGEEITLKELISAVKKRTPQLTNRDIAEALDCSAKYVNETLSVRKNRFSKTAGEGEDNS